MRRGSVRRRDRRARRCTLPPNEWTEFRVREDSGRRHLAPNADQLEPQAGRQNLYVSSMASQVGREMKHGILKVVDPTCSCAPGGARFTDTGGGLL